MPTISGHSLSIHHCGIILWLYTPVNQRDRRILKKSVYKNPLLGGDELRFSLGDHSTRIIMELEKFRDETDKIHNHVEIISPGVK